MQNLGLTHTATNKFLIILNKSIDLLLKFCHGFSKQYHIFELQSLFTTFESLISVEFLIYAVVHISSLNYFHINGLSF